MSKVIKELKELRIARECASNYDYVPDEDEAEELITCFLPEHLTLSKNDLIDILNKFNGYSVSDIDGIIMDKIDELQG